MNAARIESERELLRCRTTSKRVDCKQSLFCSRIRREERKRLSEHDSRGVESRARVAKLPALLAAVDLHSSSRILEEKKISFTGEDSNFGLLQFKASHMRVGIKGKPCFSEKKEGNAKNSNSCI